MKSQVLRSDPKQWRLTTEQHSFVGVVATELRGRSVACGGVVDFVSFGSKRCLDTELELTYLRLVDFNVLNLHRKSYLFPILIDSTVLKKYVINCEMAGLRCQSGANGISLE